MIYQTHLTLKSRNVKTGSIPVSTTTGETCPKACPFNHANAGGCYAEAGHVGMFWQKVTAKKAGAKYDQFIDQIKALPTGQFWRHNQAGDLAGNGEDIDAGALQKLCDANAGKNGFTYTHYDTLKHKNNRRLVAMANKAGFIVNLSGNNTDHADKLKALGVAPVVSVLPIEYERGKGESLPEYKTRLQTLPQKTKAGHSIVVCPATYLDNVSCKTCKLCGNGNRKTIVGFPAHGVSKKKADKIAKGN